MWKQQCFQSVYNRLRRKLSTSCAADMIISVFGEHSPLSTTTAKQEARRVLKLFHQSFRNVDNLVQTVFLDQDSINQTSKMNKIQ